MTEWGEFIELGQRRNLIIHNGGVVNEQYRTMCAREGCVSAQSAQIGSTLTIDVDYLGRALLIMRKVAFMLTHTLWRKVLPEQMAMAHDACHVTIYELLQKKMWRTAAEFGEFSLNPLNCKNLSDQHRRMRVVNTAIGYKFSEKQNECDRIIDAEDWSSSYRDFRLAVSVLKNDFDAVWAQMRQIGRKGELVDELAYRDWPLFHAVRLKPTFHVVFHEIYGEFFSNHVDVALAPTLLVPTESSPVLDLVPKQTPPKSGKQRVINRSSTMNPASIPGPTTKPSRKKKAAPKS